MLSVVVIGGRVCRVERVPCLERPLAVSAQGVGVTTTVRGIANC